MKIKGGESFALTAERFFHLAEKQVSEDQLVLFSFSLIRLLDLARVKGSTI